jgi:magnesium-transporting ATPase (P-type)
VIIDRPSKPLLLALIDGWGDFAQDPAGGVMNFFKSPEQVIFFVFLIVIIVFITMILRSWGIANQNSPFARMVFWGVIVIVLLLILLLVGGEAILEMLGLG